MHKAQSARMIGLLPILSMAATLLILSSCAAEPEVIEPQSVGRISLPEVVVGLEEPDDVRYRSSLKQLMHFLPYVARATLSSVTASTETISRTVGETTVVMYRPINLLRFTVHEWLKGTGSSSIVVTIRPRYLYTDRETQALGWPGTQEEVQQVAAEFLSNRVTTWDTKEAILFLLPETDPDYWPWYDMDEATVAESDVDKFVFELFHRPGESPWDYSIDKTEEHTRVWLPSSSLPSGASGGTAFMAASESMETTTVADLKAKATEVETMLAAGSDVAGYRDCIYRKLRDEAREAQDGQRVFAERTAAFSSGQAAGTDVDPTHFDRTGTPKYDPTRLDGKAAHLFKNVLVDDDEDPKNGYSYTVRTSRPLPAGTYSFYMHHNSYMNIPCNHQPFNAEEWTVVVTAPAGTEQEALFDPTAKVGRATGQSGAVGATDLSDSLKDLEWANGAVELTAAEQYDWHILDVIGVDGSIVLSLDSSDATVRKSQAQGVIHRWTVAEALWADGDKLMIRISKKPNRDRHP